jgi:septum formation protein
MPLPPPFAGPALVAQPVVLASGSVTRRKMLENAGLEVIIDVPNVDESEIKEAFRAEGLPVDAVAEALAELKASRVSRRYGDLYTVAADQMLECEGEWFDKPTSREEARETLRKLSGRTHHLISCAVVMRNGERLWHHIDRARLSARRLSDEFIEAYLDQIGEAAYSSVGAYQLEGLGAQLLVSVQGDHFTILGMPLLPFLQFLRLNNMLRT